MEGQYMAKNAPREMNMMQNYWLRRRGRRSYLKIHFFVEFGLKMIQFKFNSKQNPKNSFKKYSFN